MHLLYTGCRIHVVLALAALLLAACASQPQVLPVTPKVDPSAATVRGNGRTLSLDVIDARESNVVGYRDPADMNSAITTAPEAMRVIKRTLEDGYSKLGFTIVPQGENADVTMEVRLKELGYTLDPAGVIKNVHTGATIEATSIMRTKTVTGTYRDSQGKDTVLKPNREDNAIIMNKHLSAALTRMLADPRLTSEQ